LNHQDEDKCRRRLKKLNHSMDWDRPALDQQDIA